jgi:chemotaxis protein MotB
MPAPRADAGGLSEARILRAGLASSKLLESKEPNSPINRRISTIVDEPRCRRCRAENLPDEDDLTDDAPIEEPAKWIQVLPPNPIKALSSSEEMT